MSFSVISQNFLIFWWVSKNSLFWQLGPESAHPQNTIKIGVSAHQFLKNSYASRNGHFWTKKTQTHKFQLSIFFAFFFSFNNKNTKICWNPYFYSVLANLKKENFQKFNLKQRNLKNPIFAPFFRKKKKKKRLFLENWQITRHKKKITKW